MSDREADGTRHSCISGQLITGRGLSTYQMKRSTSSRPAHARNSVRNPVSVLLRVTCAVFDGSLILNHTWDTVGEQLPEAPPPKKNLPV